VQAAGFCECSPKRNLCAAASVQLGSAVGMIASGKGSMKIPADFPPVLYLPCVDETVVAQDARVQLRTTRDGRSALLVYSALDRLHACMGETHPWMVVATESLTLFWEESPFDLVLLDVVVPEHERTASR